MDPSVAVCSPSRAVKKEALIQPCFSWQTQPPPAHWSMTCTQEAGLYKILSVGSEGLGGGVGVHTASLPALLMVCGTGEATSLCGERRDASSCRGTDLGFSLE